METPRWWRDTFSNTWTVQIAKFSQIRHSFNQHDSFFGRPANATSRKSLEFKRKLSQNPGPIPSENLHE